MYKILSLFSLLIIPLFLAAQPKGKIQNVLLIMSDDLKASALPAYGDKICQTPNLDRLAATSMVFDRAYCQGLACHPSRPSMMRSIYPGSQKKPVTLGEHSAEIRHAYLTGGENLSYGRAQFPPQWRQWTGCARVLDGVSQHQVSGNLHPWSLPANEPRDRHPKDGGKAGNRYQGKILGCGGSGCSGRIGPG